MAQKYIEGDIVMYDNKIMVVKEPRDGSHFDLSCPKEGLTYCLVSVDDIEPVDLTSAILERMDGERSIYTLRIEGFQELSFVQMKESTSGLL